MTEKIGDLVDGSSAPDEMGGQAVAQEMRTSDAAEFYPAALQALAHHPRNGRRELERSHWRRERQEHIRTIHPRPCAQDVVGERGAGLIDERRHSVTLALGAPGKNLAGSPVDILELKSAQLAVANTCGGEQQQNCSVAEIDRRRRPDRVDGAANVIPRKPGRQMGQPPMRCSWNDPSEILVVLASPMQKSEKRSDVGDRRRTGGRRRRERQLMLDGGNDVLRSQRPEALARVVMAEPDQKASSAQEDAIAGLRLKAPYLAQKT